MPESTHSSNLEELRELSQYLTETESNLSSFWLFSPVMKCIARDGVLLKVNPAWEETLGYTPDELVGNKYKAFVHPDDLAKTTETENVLAPGGIVQHFYNRYKHKITGEWRTLEWWCRQDSHSRLIFGVCLDKTDEIKQKQELIAALENAKLLTTALDYSGNAVIITNPLAEDNPIVYANDTVTQLTGYTKEELIGKNCRIFEPTNFSPDQECEKHKIEALLIGEKPYIGYIQSARKDGSRFLNYLKISPVFDNGHKLVNFIASMSDASSEMKEKAILKTALNNAPFGIFLTNNEGDCIYVNKKWEELTGLEFDQAKGKGWVEGLCEEVKPYIAIAWYEYTEKAKADPSLVFRLNSCFHNRQADIKTPVIIHAYFYDHSTTIGYVLIEPIE